ncbi:MAG: epoxyqueuosine reductase QueH [Bacteroidales bacterium]|nr:epoxyqueuosine reductase QueH [Bacteroidales bacterium]
MLKIEVPGGESKVLLHSCCAPCSGAVLECLVANDIRPVVFFSNSNIVPFEEYELRLRELRRYCEALGVRLVEDEYDHQAWLNFILDTHGGLSKEELAAAPERGPRCLRCFKFRLLRAAQYAAQNHIPVLTTTLASSRWKSLEQVDAAGAWVCSVLGPTVASEGNARPGVFEGTAPQSPGGAGGSDSATAPVLGPVWWSQNWRKGGLQPRRAEIIKEQNFYNQDFCGCEFSKHQ